MTHKTYTQFLERWEEVTDLPPQTLGPLTRPYKKVTKRLKVMPWPWFLIGGIFLVLSVYLVLGPAITFFTSLLQRGF